MKQYISADFCKHEGIREYQKDFYTQKFDNKEEMEQFLKKQSLAQLIQIKKEEIKLPIFVDDMIV